MGYHCCRTPNRTAGKEWANRVLAVSYCTYHLPAIDPCTSAPIVPAVNPAATAATTVDLAAAAPGGSPAIDPAADAATRSPINPRTSLSRRWRCQPGAADYRCRDRRP